MYLLNRKKVRRRDFDRTNAGAWFSLSFLDVDA